MRLFSCDFCNQVVHFDNRQCVSCGHRLGFDPELMAMYALESAGGTQWQLAGKPFETPPRR
ncbi:zinc-ribbon domain-containing protein [Sinorhizobium fredii]|uniref:zinc-ribbon domain-containing protein n=1 Tax=Rhizobium fredii TaxID=380 RepID=UPI003F71941D